MVNKMIIDIRKKFLFVHNPRTGGSTFRHVTKAFSQGWPRVYKMNGIPINKIQYNHPGHAAISDVEGINPDEYAYKFTVVRNTWERTVSYFLKVRPPGDLKHADKIFNSFDKFVDSIYKRKSPALPQYPQTYWTRGVDEILFFNEWQKNWESIFEKCGLPYVERPLINGSIIPRGLWGDKNSPTLSSFGYHNFYRNPETIDKIYECFKKEIELFGFIFSQERK